MPAGPGRWDTIERLYHAALTRPVEGRAAFLAEACGGDDELRREVESLLAQQISAAGVLTGGAVAAAAGLVSDVGRSALTGRRLGSYQILAPIGAGGMGEIYRARDMRLGREVAIKILPRAFTADADRLARFEREARVLASLNHPHIAAIYGVEDAPTEAGSPVRALVLELVEGETLAERIGRSKGGLPVKEALAMARQIADALDAAHEKGIVHRDLKPANIKVTPDGVVKVLDFGLAKAATSDGMTPDFTASPTVTVGGTRDGIILGTAAYMSPEQARGQAVDKRTDIWAFGCVVFEMLTGHIAFSGETISDTIGKILEREPDWRKLPATLPSGAGRLIKRCLEKDSKRRLRDIGDARTDIDDALSASDPVPVGAAHAGTSSLRLWPTLAICFLALSAGGITLSLVLLPGSTSAPAVTPTAGTIATRLTSYGGRQDSGTISPDGRSFAFVSDHAGTPDIWLRQVSGGEPVRLTNDAVQESDLAFAPDGERIYFSRPEQGTSAIWQIGTLGGQARKVIASGHSAAPSPDGRVLAYIVPEQQPGNEALVVSALDGSEKRVLAQHIPWFPRVRPAWASDGHRIAYIRAGLFAPANLFVVDRRDGRERQVTRFTRAGQTLGTPVWLPDDRHLVASYAAYSRTQSAPDLAVVDAEDGSISRVTTTIDDGFTAPSLSADGSRLIATAGGQRREVWRVSLKSTDADANGRTAVRLIDATQDPLWTFVTRDGRTLLFNSPASGSRNLWVMPLDGTATPRQITAVAGDAIGHSSLSPDGMRVAFVSFAGGASDIWTQSVDGSDLRQLTNDTAADSWPVWSPDGRSIVYTSASGGSMETRVMPANGGPGQKLFDGFFRGDWVEQPGGSGTWIVTSNGTEEIRLIDVEKRAVLWAERVVGSGFGMPTFSPDRRSISVPYQEDRDHDSVAIFDVATHQRRLAVRLPFHLAFRAAWTTNGTALIVNRADTISHIVLFDRFWGRADR